MSGPDSASDRFDAQSGAEAFGGDSCAWVGERREDPKSSSPGDVIDEARGTLAAGVDSPIAKVLRKRRAPR